jgi:hypothetical protein
MLGQYLRSSRQLRLEGTATLVQRCKPVAGADTMADAVNGVFENTAGGIVVLNSRSIAAAKEIELSNALLDLLRQAGEKDPEWQATRDAALRKNQNVATGDTP